jgi:DNA-binding transcriptional regulator YdaS (Cro superfamily)
MMKLQAYINQRYQGNQAAFARAQGVKPQQVSQWLKKDFLVVDGVLCSQRRVLK